MDPTANREPDPDPDPIVRRDHGCFGCGEANPCGLRLAFVRDGDGVRAAYTPRRQDEGFFGVVHGGIVATMLDEAMAWAAFAAGVWAVTAKMEVRFRAPVEVDVGLALRGRVSGVRGRFVETAGEIRRTADDVILTEATALFVRVPAAQARRWQERYLAAPDR